MAYKTLSTKLREFANSAELAYFTEDREDIAYFVDLLHQAANKLEKQKPTRKKTIHLNCDDLYMDDILKFLISKLKNKKNTNFKVNFKSFFAKDVFNKQIYFFWYKNNMKYNNGGEVQFADLWIELIKILQENNNRIN